MSSIPRIPPLGETLDDDEQFSRRLKPAVDAPTRSLVEQYPHAFPAADPDPDPAPEPAAAPAPKPKAKPKTKRPTRPNAPVNDGRRAFERTLDGFVAALDHLRIGLRYNVRGHCFEWAIGGGPYQASTDSLDALVRAGHLEQRVNTKVFTSTGLQIHRGYKLGQEQWNIYKHAAVHDRQYDPFVDWMDGLEEWDRGNRGRTFLRDHMRASDHALDRHGSILPLLQVCRYLDQPGAKMDESLMLVGDTGSAKSSAYKALLPKQFQLSGYGDGASLQQPNKVLGESMENAIFVEMADADLHVRDIGAAKRWLTSTNDGGFRPAYGYHKQDRPRIAAVIFTADKPDCMSPDPAMMRRIIPVSVSDDPNRTEEDPTPYQRISAWLDETINGIAEYRRRQLWAEARHIVRQHGDPFLPINLRPEQIRRGRMMMAGWTSVHDRILAREGELDGLALDGIMAACDLDRRSTRDSDVCAALKHLGYVAGPRRYVSRSWRDGTGATTTKRVWQRAWSRSQKEIDESAAERKALDERLDEEEAAAIL